MRCPRFAAAAALCLFACSDSLSETESPLTGGVSVTAGDVVCNGATDVAVSITGTSTTTTNATDVMLVIDESGSIGAPNFDLVKQFMRDLVNGVDVFDHGGKVGIVYFAGSNSGAGGSARVISPLSASRTAVIAAINASVYTAGFTCTGCGIELSTDQFQAGSAAGHHRVALVVTDGIANSYRPTYHPPPGTPPGEISFANAMVVDALAEGAGEGVTYIAIGVGASIDLTQLRVIGTGPGDTNVFTTPNFSTLSQTSFQDVITSPEATNAMLALVINSLFAPGTPTATLGTATQVGQDIGWTIPAIQDTTATLTFAVTHTGSVDGTFQVIDSYTYSDTEGNALSLPNVSITVTGCDADGDGVPDNEDDCLGTDPGDPVDENGCSVEQLCDCPGARNHGEYVSCVAHTSKDFERQGLLTQAQRTALVVEAAHSSCGK